MNITVVTSGGLTDVLHAAPLVAALSDRDNRLSLVCAPRSEAVASRLTGVDELLVVAGLGERPSLLGLGRLWLALRARRIDVAVVASSSGAVLATVYLAGVPRRVGCDTGPISRLLTERVPCAEDGNRARSIIGLCRALRVTPPPIAGTFDPGQRASGAAEEVLLSNGIGDGRLLVAIAPGLGFAEVTVARWSSERYAHLANRLASRHGAGVVLVGDERDRELAEAMRFDLAAESVDLCGEADLLTTAAVIARCDLLVSGDTPLLQVAATVGTTSVGIFGPTDGRVRAPAGGEHRVVQALAAGRAPASLDNILVDDVLAGIESAL